MGTRREFLGSAVAGALLSGESAFAGQTGPIPDSDVGSLYPFIASQSAKQYPLSWLQPEFRDLRAWKRRARGKLLELLHYTPPRVDPRPAQIERMDRGDHFLERLTFQTTPDLRVPAFLLIPKNASLPAPGIIALHDHGGFYFWGKEKLVDLPDEHPALSEFKRQYYAGRSIATELARRGYVVMVIDMFYWGERRMLLKNDPPDWRERPPDISPQRISAFNQRAGESEALVGRTIFAAGITWAGVMLWDDLRTLDYLAGRPEVDARRLGCIGLSVGGLRSMHLAALDDRIKAAVIAGWMTSFPHQLERHVRYTIGHTKLIPGLYRLMDYPDVAAMAAPAALLVINGSRDPLFEPSGVRESFAKLQACYRKARAEDRLRTRLFDSPHELNAQMQQEAWEWLDLHLGKRAA